MADTNEQNNSATLRQKLTVAHSTFKQKQRVNALFSGVILFLLWIISLVLIEQIAYFSPSIKTTLLLLLGLVTGFTIWNGFKKIVSQPFIEFYRGFARSTKLPQLSYALDLEKSTNANPKLVEAAIFKNLQLIDSDILTNHLEQFLEQSPVTKQLTFKRNLSLASLVILITLSFGMNASVVRLTKFYKNFEKPNPYSFNIKPGNTTLEQGGPFSVTVSFNGELPDEVVLMLKTTVEENFRSRGMSSNGDTFSSIPFDLNNEIVYYLEMDGYKSEPYEAKVQLRPRFTDLTATIIPPSYTPLDSTILNYPFSQLSGYQGSILKLSGISNKELQQLNIIRSTKIDSILLDTENAFKYSFSISNPDTFSFKLTDKSNLENQNPFFVTVNPLKDEYPFVELIEPKASYESIEPSSVNILFKASDDFSVSTAVLNYELKKAFVDAPITGQLKLKTPRNGVIEAFPWDIKSLNLKPKDELTFWIEVTDNDGYNGSKTSRSELITLTIPSLIDYFDDIGEEEDDVETELEDISDAFKEMSEQYETFKEQLKEDPETNYEQKRQLEEVQRQQNEVEERIEELNKKFDEIKKELSEKNMLSEETMEAYQELQELMKEIDDPSFREALEKLQEQMSEMTPEQLRDALKDAEFNEELYKERLERTLELFKELKLQSDLEKLAQTYEDLARQEEELENESLSSEEEQKQRESTLDQTEQVKEKIDELSKNASEKNEKDLAEFQEITKEEVEKLQQKLKEKIEELKKDKEKSESESPGEQDESESESESESDEQQEEEQPQQQNLKQDFQKLANMTRQQMKQMQQKKMQINVAGLQYILYSLLNLSVEQEDLVTYANSTENRSQAYIEYARDQKNVEGIFVSLSDSLFALSKQIPQFSNQINTKKLEVETRLKSSLEQMAERNQSQASVATRQALGGINEIAFLIANLLEQLQNSDNNGQGSGSGQSMQQMMEQMQQMGEDQQQLNQQMQDMINDIQGERLNQDQMERLDQLSKQQNKIRQQLQELQRNGSLKGGDKLGSQIERMIEEMEDTINDLRGGAVDPTLIQRQQNILSRMLEAEKSMQEQDEEEKREGTTGTEINRVTPPELTLEELEKQIRNRLNDPNFTKYSSDYQRLIEKYFELLKQIQEREIQ